VGTTLGENRLGDAFDFRLLALFRAGDLIVSPASDEVVAGGDLLLSVPARDTNKAPLAIALMLLVVGVVLGSALTRPRRIEVRAMDAAC
jgi:hypothetical protein